MNSEYQLIVGSPVDYNELVVYIWLNGEEIALVQKEEGVNKMKIEFFEGQIMTDVYFDIFVNALQEAKKELMKGQV